MKNCITNRIFSCAVWILISGSLRGSDPQLVDRYYTMAYPTDRLILKANETAIIDYTLGFDVLYDWMYILYQQGTNLPVNLTVPLHLELEFRLGQIPLPLPGPAVITLNTNHWEDGPLYTGAAGLKILRTIHKIPAVAARLNPSEFERYYTLTEPTDKVTLRVNETAIIVGTTKICDECSSEMNILYRKEPNDFLNIILPLGFTGGTMPLSGPGVVMLNTNGAPGALQLKLIRTGDERLSARYHKIKATPNYFTLAYPGDRLILKANEIAIIDGTVVYDSTYGWVNILYKRGTNDFTNMILGRGLTGGTMPLSGPGVVMLNTNNANIFGAVYTGAVGVRIVRTIDRNPN